MSTELATRSGAVAPWWCSGRLTYAQMLSFRHILGERLAQLVEGEAITPLGDSKVDEISNGLLGKLVADDCLAKHRLLDMPVGVGGLSWWAVVARLVARAIGPMHSAERRAIHMAQGSALRLALLQGTTYRGRVPDPRFVAWQLRWTKVELSAYARRFRGGMRWSEMHAEAVASSPGEGSSEAWRKVSLALAVGDVTWDEWLRLRRLRESYTSYVNPYLSLRLPWEDGAKVAAVGAHQWRKAA